jgi:hypothetical protein
VLRGRAAEGVEERDQVSPSLAEACVALDVPAGPAVLVLAFVG